MPRGPKKLPDSKLRRVQPYRKLKEKRETDSKKIDIIGELLRNYSLPAREIFSYMDFSSLREGRLVCKLWNHFLVNDRLLSLRMLMKTKPYLENMFEYVSNYKAQCAPGDTSAAPYYPSLAPYKKSVKGYLECIKTQENSEKWSYGKIFKICRRILNTIAAFHECCCRGQGINNTFFYNNGQLDYRLWEFVFNFRYRLMGRKLYEEIDKDFYLGNDNFFEMLSDRVAEIKGRQDRISDVKASTRWVLRFHSINGPPAIEIQRGIQPIITWEEITVQALLKSILKGMKRELCSDVENFEFQQ